MNKVTAKLSATAITLKFSRFSKPQHSTPSATTSVTRALPSCDYTFWGFNRSLMSATQQAVDCRTIIRPLYPPPRLWCLNQCDSSLSTIDVAMMLPRRAAPRRAVATAQPCVSFGCFFFCVFRCNSFAIPLNLLNFKLKLQFPDYNNKIRFALFLCLNAKVVLHFALCIFQDHLDHRARRANGGNVARRATLVKRVIR